MNSNILVHEKDFVSLENFLLSKCVESQRFGTQLYVLCSSMGDYGMLHSRLSFSLFVSLLGYY
jgi:hypothetical protein